VSLDFLLLCPLAFVGFPPRFREGHRASICVRWVLLMLTTPACDRPKDPLRMLGEIFLQRSKELEGTTPP